MSTRDTLFYAHGYVWAALAVVALIGTLTYAILAAVAPDPRLRRKRARAALWCLAAVPAALAWPLALPAAVVWLIVVAVRRP